jgi:hypothetical protein
LRISPTTAGNSWLMTRARMPLPVIMMDKVDEIIRNSNRHAAMLRSSFFSNRQITEGVQRKFS